MFLSASLLFFIWFYVAKSSFLSDIFETEIQVRSFLRYKSKIENFNFTYSTLFFFFSGHQPVPRERASQDQWTGFWWL
jgi:hypothetical protein